MSYFPNPFAPPPHFLLESVELLLARLGQLSHHVRDTVARIIGSTVAEAVSEALQFAMRRLQGRRASSWRESGWPPDVDPYDPFVDDSTLAAHTYSPMRSAGAGRDDWRAPWRALAAFLAATCQKVWQTAIAHHWRIAVTASVGLLALFVARNYHLPDA